MNRSFSFAIFLLTTGCPRSPSEPVVPPVQPLVQQPPVAQDEPAKDDRIKRFELGLGLATLTENGVVDFHGSPEIRSWLEERGPIEDIWLSWGACIRTAEGVWCRTAKENDEVRIELPTKAELIDVQWSWEALWALTSDGTLWYAWDDTPHRVPLKPFPGISNVVEFDAYHQSGCARLEDGSTQCWMGKDDRSKFCTEAVGCEKLARTWPAPQSTFTNTRDTAVGLHYFCLLGEDGVPRCHDPYPAELASLGSAELAAIEGMPPLVEIENSTEHICGRSDAGEVWCWGANAFGQLGDGTTQSHRTPTPVRVEGLPMAEHLAVGENRSCALADGEIWCWGSLPDTPADVAPTEIPGIVASDLEVEEDRVCARVERSWKCWGGDNETAGGAEAASKIIDAKLDGKFDDGCRFRSGRLRCEADGEVWLDLKGVIDVSRGSYPLCALLRERVECHGFGREPVVIPVPASVAMHGENDYGCVLTERKGVHCWEDSWSIPPIALPGQQVAVSVGYRDACALDDRGNVRCWTGGQPAVVAGVTDVVQVEGGMGFGCARDSAGGIACWGYGMIADPDAPGPSVDKPVTVQLPAPAVEFDMGYSEHVCARLGDGRVFCWGLEQYGQRARLSAEFATRPRKITAHQNP